MGKEPGMEQEEGKNLGQIKFPRGVLHSPRGYSSRPAGKHFGLLFTFLHASIILS